MVHVSTVWMDRNMLRGYLIIGDQFLWFGTIMNHSIINPNKVKAFNIPVHDNPLDETIFVIEADRSFIPINYNGIVIIFESQVPTKWEEHNLSVIFLPGTNGILWMWNLGVG